MSSEEKYPQAAKLAETNFGPRLEKIKRIQEAYDKAVEKRNQISVMLQKVDWNQLDRQIVELSQAISSYGLSDSDWKTVVKKGLETVLLELDVTLSRLTQNLIGVIGNPTKS